MKKLLLFCVAVIMSLSLAVIASADEFKYGDVNSDTSIDAGDALAVLKHAAKIQILDENAQKAAEVTGEGSIDAGDALDILKYAAKLIDSFAIEDMVVVTETPTEVPRFTPIPTEPPVIIGPGVWPTMIPLPVVEADAANYVEGIALTPSDLNGATEENGIYTFTEVNTTNRKGVSFKNPFADKDGELLESFEKALEGQNMSLTADQIVVYDPEADYPMPVWNTGVSLSFWAKYEWDNENISNDDPILVFHRSNNFSNDFVLSLCLNGTVRFEEGSDAHNSFRADGAVCGNVNEWNYYTITIKNDWITVYVNGQECAYHKVSLSKEAIGLFNGGYMTKYNVAGGEISDEMLANDIRHYYKTSGVVSGNTIDMEATHIDNGVFENAGYHSGAALLMKCMVEDDAELVIGGTTTYKVVGNMGRADYALEAGTQAAGVKAYFVELTPEQVAANYAVEAEAFFK